MSVKRCRRCHSRDSGTSRSDREVSGQLVLHAMRPRRLSATARLPFDQIRFFSSCMFRPRPRISLVSTSKLAGVPASSVFSPLTIDS